MEPTSYCLLDKPEMPYLAFCIRFLAVGSLIRAISKAQCIYERHVVNQLEVHPPGFIFRCRVVQLTCKSNITLFRDESTNRHAPFMV